MNQKSSRQTVLDALPGTIPQIVELTGVCRATVYRWLAELRADAKCYIKSWRRTAGRFAPYFVAGEGVDAPEPKPRTSAEHSHKHYVKHRRALEAELRVARNEARGSAARAAKTPQNWASALLGAAVREVRHA